jgi:hypothetical protein
MKINLTLVGILFALAVTSSRPAGAQVDQQQIAEPLTNLYSLEPREIRDETWQEYERYVSALRHHVRVPETLAASQDTNDIWGSETNQFQLSLRFRDSEYTATNVVPAISILRNLDVYPEKLLLTNSGCLYLTFMVRYETNRVVNERREGRRYPLVAYTDGSSIPSSPHGLLEWRWDARSEKELVLDLNRIFDLSHPGTYSVEAICWVYSPATRSRIYKIASGIASFRIIRKQN